MNWLKKAIEWARPAFDEMLVYAVALLGLVVGPVLTVDDAGNWQPVWPTMREFAVAVIIAGAVIGISELSGTKDEKEVPKVRIRRYVFAFVIGLLGIPGAKLIFGMMKDLILGAAG